MKILKRPRCQASVAAASRSVGRPGPFEVTAHERRCVRRNPAQQTGAPMAPLTHDEDITSWLQLLSAIEEAEAGRGTARLAEVCLSVYGALADARFQITQLRARVHVLAASGPRSHASPVTATSPQLHPHLPTHRQQHPARGV